MPSAKEKNSPATNDGQIKQSIPTQDSPGLILVESGAIFQGAEEFVVTRSAINLEKPGALTKEKVAAVEKLLRPSYLSGRSTLIVGSKPGFFVFGAVQNDATSVTVLEPDNQYLNSIKKAAGHIGFDNIFVSDNLLANYTEKKDVVLALSAEEWCTNNDTGVTDKTIESLSKLCNYLMLIESPPGVDLSTILQKHFKRVEPAGVADGKSFFAAFKTKHELDLSCPMPEYLEGGQVISCRLLTEFAGLQYWSRVYAGKNAFYKQATRELAEREQLMLSKLKSPYFPRVEELKECGDSSVLVLEKIDGLALEESFEQVTSSVQRFAAFATDCLQILAQLQENNIEHRDIQPGNLLIRNGKPVLIDFGWAVSPELPMFVPAGLLSIGPDGQVCDAYSLGRILHDLSSERFPEFHAVFDLMTEPDPSARITSAVDLLGLIKLMPVSGRAADPNENSNPELVRRLLNGLKINRARLAASEEKHAKLQAKTRDEKDHRLAVLEMEFDKVVNDNTRVISELHRLIAEKDELLALLDERQKLIEGITQSQAWQLANRLQKSKQSINKVFKKSP